MSEPNDIVERLAPHIVASCTCLTKSHEPQFHSEDCLYRALSDAMREITHLRSTLQTTSVQLDDARTALATAEAAGMERARRLEFFNHTFQPLVGLVGLAIAEGDLEGARKRFDALIDAWDRSLIPSVQSPAAGNAEIEGLRKALDEIRTDAFLLGTAINERDPYDELFVRVNAIMRHVNTALSSKEPTP